MRLGYRNWLVHCRGCSIVIIDVNCITKIIPSAGTSERDTKHHQTMHRLLF